MTDELTCDEARAHAAKAHEHEDAAGRWADQAREFSTRADAALRGSEDEARQRCGAAEALRLASEEHVLAWAERRRAWLAEGDARQRGEAHERATAEGDPGARP
jgi:hypothetical protein